MDERTPFINSPSSRALGTPLSEHPSSDGTEQSTQVISHRTEVLRLARATLPISASFALQNTLQAWSILMVGTLGAFELGVASYAYMFASCTGSMVAIGGSTALDTLCGQAFIGTTQGENPHVLGLYLQQGLLILCLIFTFMVAPVWWFSGQLFIVLSQPEDFATATGTFLRIFIPGGLLQIITECLKKFLQVQGQRSAVTYIVTVSTFIGMVANFVFFRIARTGIWGAPVAHTIYHLSNTVGLLAFICCSKVTRATWGGFSKKVFKNLGRVASLSVTGILTVATEWWR
jgi:MATE family multidrug resistance protein